MKIVLAEKVSPATLAVFQQEPGWNVVTHDQIKDGLAAELADADALVVRSAVQVDDKLLEAAPRSSPDRDTHVVRPDGYVGLTAGANDWDAVDRYLAKLA